MRIRTILITGIAATVATIGLATAANANVSYDDASVGSVDKTDVQALFGWNDAKLQQNAATIKFTSQKVAKFDWSWKCSDNNTYHWIYTMTTSQPVTITAKKNPHDKVLGWTLNGVTGTPATTNESTGPQMFTCPDGGMGAALPFASSTTNGVQVNGVDLPVTPVEVPVV
jgi:hypothetical protein